MLTVSLILTALALGPAGAESPAPAARTPRAGIAITYHIEDRTEEIQNLFRRYDAEQLALLEKLNRADLRNLVRLPEVVVPDRWDADELAYSPLPDSSGWAEAFPKALIVHLPGQVFGAYERGRLVRWGPISSGRQSMQTPAGRFHLNWRSRGRHSTVDPTWYMTWYFNFHNTRGLSLHAYALPGLPASHACVRLLDRDARWLYDWGEQWKLSDDGVRIERQGSPMLVLGPYDFSSPPPWRSLEWLSGGIELPSR